jgi:hypothetical protein
VDSGFKTTGGLQFLERVKIKKIEFSLFEKESICFVV